MLHETRAIKLGIALAVIAGMCMATPAISGDTLIIRGAQNLYAIRED